MTKKRRKQRKAKRHFFLSRSFAISLVLFLLLALFLYRQAFHFKDSNSVTQTALISDIEQAKLYPYPFDFQSQKLEQSSQVRVERYYLAKIKGKETPLAKIEHQGKSYYLEAKYLEIDQDNPVNNYIASLAYPHKTVSLAINSTFRQVPYASLSGKPKGIIIHDTGNEGSTLADEVSYMINNYAKSGVFVQSFIDQEQIYQIASNQFMAQGAGPNANPYYLQFELIHEDTADGFALQLANAAYYTASQLKQNGLLPSLAQEDGSGTIWTHALVTDYLGGTDHSDPDDYWVQSGQEFFASPYELTDFFNLVQAYYNQL